MSAHSAGPWSYDSYSDGILSSEGETLCQLNEWREEFWPEKEANARLIAAAPDLLKALETFVDCRDEARAIDDCLPDASNRAWAALFVKINAAEDKARAAIAAAKGEQ